MHISRLSHPLTGSKIWSEMDGIRNVIQKRRCAKSWEEFCEEIFVGQLASWFNDETISPQDRSFEAFTR